MSTSVAIKRLIDGNHRFVSGQLTHPHLEISRRIGTARDGQKPFAAVLGCIDSRVPVETLFDQGIGDLVVIRNSGNIVDDTVLSTMELVVEWFDLPLIVVLGHTDCQTVKAAVHDHQYEGRRNTVIDRVRHFAGVTKQIHPEKPHHDLYTETAKLNLMNSAQVLLRESEFLRDLVQKGNLRIETGLYHLDSGKVEWMGFQLDKKVVIG